MQMRSNMTLQSIKAGSFTEREQVRTAVLLCLTFINTWYLLSHYPCFSESNALYVFIVFALNIFI